MLLGVDGGNTKTVALVAAPDGTILGAGRGGCADVYGTRPPEAAYEAIATAVHTALAAAGASAADLGAAVYSLAGADWPEDHARYRRELAARVGGPVTVVNDAIGALRAGTPDGVGASLVCGTGTAVGARGPDGHVFHLSFWASPSFILDLPRAAVEAAVRCELGLERESSLRTLVPGALGARSVEEMLRHQTLLGAQRPSKGPAGAALLDAAAAGDALAVEVLERVAGHMAGYLRACAARAGLAAPSPLVLAGGLFRHPSSALRERLAAELPGVSLVPARFEPAVGALLCAFDERGVPADAARLEASAPGAALFATGS